jgi:hypothetical protein
MSRASGARRPIRLPLESDRPCRGLLDSFLFIDYTGHVRFQFNRFLLMLLMLALPVQTFASAAMPGCAFSHQRPAAYPGMLEHMVMAEGKGAKCHESEQPGSSPTSHTCKHCAACSLASAMLIPSMAFTSVAPAPHSVIPHFSASFIGFIPDNPERPPRTHFA